MDYNEYASQIALVSVQFESKRKPGTFTQKEYTYIADAPLSVGDVVKAPTRSGESTARVSRTNIPLSELQCRVGQLLHITEAPTPGGDMFSGFYDGSGTEDFVVLPEEEATVDPAPPAVPVTDLTIPIQEAPPRELIVIRQLPVIEEHLLTVKQEVQAKVAEAVSMVCCDDTLTAVKAVRAELNKEFAGWEDKRKRVKDAIEAPYKQFNTVYKDCVSDIFSQADTELRDKINATETGMKNGCAEAVQKFFNDLTTAKHLEWLPYEKAGIKISLTDAKLKTQPPKKLCDQVTQFVERVAQDVEMIQTLPDAGEIMAEYHQCLNATAAINAVDLRHRQIADAQAREAERQAAMARDAETVQRVQHVAPPVPVVQPPVRAAAAAPTKDPNEVLRLQFTVTDTRAKLKLLKQFLDANGYNYQ